MNGTFVEYFCTCGNRFSAGPELKGLLCPMCHHEVAFCKVGKGWMSARDFLRQQREGVA